MAVAWRTPTALTAVRPSVPLKFFGRAKSKKVDYLENNFAGYAGRMGYTIQNGAICVGFCFLANFYVGAASENFFRVNAKVLPKVVDKNIR